MGHRSTGTGTRLGRAVQATAAAAGLRSHGEQHPRTNWLRDVILGGQDGLVNILGIILGVIAGGGSTTVLSAGFAAAITESISMGAVGYTSALSERDYYQADPARPGAAVGPRPSETVDKSKTRRTVVAANPVFAAAEHGPRPHARSVPRGESSDASLTAHGHVNASSSGLTAWLGIFEWAFPRWAPWLSSVSAVAARRRDRRAVEA